MNCIRLLDLEESSTEKDETIINLENSDYSRLESEVRVEMEKILHPENDAQLFVPHSSVSDGFISFIILFKRPASIDC